MNKKEQRKQLIQSYQEKERQMGVFSITNKVNGRRLIGASANLEGAWNRELFGLETGLHGNKLLQADWNEFGPGAFEFEVLERIETKDKLTFDYKDVFQAESPDLATQKIRDYRKAAAKREKIWIEKMNSYIPEGYNER
ncbi:GIY-YIG nuclease family protein [Paenibacillus aurantiacus]|uniref:GIY-YIG nuclease family protein n=1 Tax=Paenibacillus aurantiacus TaxID=1936118 RepID=A0ABV5KU22_9BACL